MESVEFLCHILPFQRRQLRFSEVWLISMLNYTLSKRRRIIFTLRRVNFPMELGCTENT